jgi:hypothetical protein
MLYFIIYQPFTISRISVLQALQNATNLKKYNLRNGSFGGKRIRKPEKHVKSLSLSASVLELSIMKTLLIAIMSIVLAAGSADAQVKHDGRATHHTGLSGRKYNSYAPPPEKLVMIEKDRKDKKPPKKDKVRFKHSKQVAFKEPNRD